MKLTVLCQFPISVALSSLPSFSPPPLALLFPHLFAFYFFPFCQGCWRKIMVDDALPFDEDNNLLLPATTNQSELWPMLLAKAIIKLANTE